MRRVDGRKVTRLTLRDLSSCLRARFVERRSDGTAEVSRGHSSRGPAVRSIETLAREGRNSRGSQDRIATGEGPNRLKLPDAKHSMPEPDADKKAERLERAGKVGGGTAEVPGTARQAIAASGEKAGEGAPGHRRLKCAS